MEVSTRFLNNGGSPKWLVDFMENPIELDDLEVITPILGNLHMYFSVKRFETSWGVHDFCEHEALLVLHPSKLIKHDQTWRVLSVNGGSAREKGELKARLLEMMGKS